MAEVWSRLEVLAIVADYLSMLQLELRGEKYNKAAHNRALALQLNGRSHGSIERKHQNISAILINLGYPYVEGYKPLFNYQALLEEVVTERVLGDAALSRAVEVAVEQPAEVPRVRDILDRWEDPPKPRESPYGAVTEPRLASRRTRPKINYLEREHRNASLGLAGEEFVVEFERMRLLRSDRPKLAERVEQVSQTEGDGAGFDVRSFEENGSDRLIEVKTTAYGKETPFYVTRNELAFSQSSAETYQLYRLFRFRQDPRLFAIRGAIDQACTLQPIQYAAQWR